MELIPESVSEHEAEDLYPTQYWEGTKTKRSFDMTTDDLQDAYMRGREAEPCEEQVEAVARVLAVANAYYSDSGFYHLDGIKKALNENEDFWSYKTVEDVSDLMEVARMVLEAARKAVM